MSGFHSLLGGCQARGIQVDNHNMHTLSDAQNHTRDLRESNKHEHDMRMEGMPEGREEEGGWHPPVTLSRCLEWVLLKLQRNE